jgi:hypothetical protein
MFAVTMRRVSTMGRVSAGLPAGVRISDHISLGVIARTFPPDAVRQVLTQSGRASQRQRDLPAPVRVYYVIALGLYTGTSLREVLRCLRDGLRWVWGPSAVKVAGQSGRPKRHFPGAGPSGGSAFAGAV